MAVSVGLAGAGLGAAAGAAAVAPATAATAPTVTTPAATTTTPTVAAPAKGSLALYVHKVFTLGRTQVTIPDRKVQVDGIERPYVPGQRATLRVYLNGRLVRTYGLRIRAADGGKYGRISYPIRSAGVGKVTAVVHHVATPQLSAFTASRSFEALNDSASFGSSGPFVQLIQQRLQALHLFIPQTGVYDAGTGWALDAYHRLMGWGTAQTLDPGVINALLNGKGTFAVHDPGDGRHAEGNLSDQLLALVNGSHVYWILPISSGKPSTPTILGHFHIYSRVPGYLPDGMYYSDFFYGGYAIHGYNPAPDYPASHGCMRLQIADAIPVFNWLALGDAVDVYY
jgi:hypothetical protein